MTDSTRTAVDNWYAAIKAGDWAALRDATTSDVVVDYPAPDGALPWSGEWQGYDRLQAFFRTIGDHLSVDRVEVTDTFETGDAFITVLKGQWTVRSNGRKVNARAVNIFRIRNGLVARYQVHNDTAAFAKALD